jgi:serine/threonine-protein kinase
MSVAFVADATLKTVALSGGPPTTVTEGVAAGIDWETDGMVYFRFSGGLPAPGIHRAPARGGEVEQVTSDASHRLPNALPNGRGLLVTSAPGGPERSRIAVVGPEGGEARVLFPGTMARYASSGHVVYATLDGTLMAAPFDLTRLEVTGPSVALLEGVQVKGTSSSNFALSESGSLLYKTGTSGDLSEFVWVTRSGEVIRLEAGWTFAGGTNEGWSLSPDGTRLALKAETQAGADIWVKQLPTGPLSRLTFHEGVDERPRWAPDGESLTFISDRSGTFDVWSQRADGTEEARLLFSDLAGGEAFWSPIADRLVLRTGGTSGVVGRRDLLTFRPGVDSAAVPLLDEEFDESAAALSPDGRWLAYVSTETGSLEVFVRPFPNVRSGKWPVSTAGGVMPMWAHSGRELFFADGGRALIAAEIETAPSFQIGAKDTLFVLPPEFASATTGVTILYDITPDDQRFLMVRRYQGDPEDAQSARLILVQNFFEELEARVPN